MAVKKPEMLNVEVDMVPLIDIISLLLMFLVMVGDMAKSATNVSMKLPRATEAKSDKDLLTEGRIVVQVTDMDREKKHTGRYKAIVENSAFDLVPSGQNQTLVTFLNEQIARRKAKGTIELGPNGEVPFPVKLRVPEDAPMREVERVVMTLASVKLVNVQYASEPK